jgi:hypothetical protein
MSAPRHWTGLGCGLGALTILLLFVLGPSGPPLSFQGVLLASAALLIVGVLLRRVGAPAAQATGGVLAGIGVAWLALVGGLIALVVSQARNWGP